jgi:hypothetical protein
MDNQLAFDQLRAPLRIEVSPRGAQTLDRNCRSQVKPSQRCKSDRLERVVRARLRGNDWHRAEHRSDVVTSFIKPAHRLPC